MSETSQAQHEATITLSGNEIDFVPHDIPSTVSSLEEAVEVLKDGTVMSMFVSHMMHDRIKDQIEHALETGRNVPSVEPAAIAYRAATMTQMMMRLLSEGAEGWAHRDDETFLYGEVVVTELLNEVLADIHAYRKEQQEVNHA